MALVDLDLTKPEEIPDRVWVATITKADIKVPEEGDLNDKGNQKKPYINWAFLVTDPSLKESNGVESKLLFHITSFGTAWKVKEVVEAARVSYSEKGFDTDDCLNKQVRITTAVEESAQYGKKNIITKIEPI